MRQWFDFLLGPPKDILQDIISLAGYDIPMEIINKWSISKRKYALKWASLEHLSASDNPVTRITIPEGIQNYRAELSFD